MRGVLTVGPSYVERIFKIGGIGQRAELPPKGVIVRDNSEFSRLIDLCRSKYQEVRIGRGGSITDAVELLTKVGIDTAFIGPIGYDQTSNDLMTMMGTADLSHAIRVGKAGMSISLLNGGRRLVALQPNANDHFMISKLIIDYANEFQIVHMAPFLKDLALREEIGLAMGLAEEIVLSLDLCNDAMRLGLDDLFPLIGRTDILFVDESAVKRLTGIDLKGGTERILGLGPDIVILEKDNCLEIITKEGTIEIPRALDRSELERGISGFLAGAFLSGLVKGWGLRRCGEFAESVAAIIDIEGGADNIDKKKLISLTKGRK